MGLPKATESISLRVEPELKAKLAELAREDGRSLANYIGWVLARHVETREAPDTFAGRMQWLEQVEIPRLRERAALLDSLPPSARDFDTTEMRLQGRERELATMQAMEKMYGP